MTNDNADAVIFVWIQYYSTSIFHTFYQVSILTTCKVLLYRPSDWHMIMRKDRPQWEACWNLSCTKFPRRMSLPHFCPKPQVGPLCSQLSFHVLSQFSPSAIRSESFVFSSQQHLSLLAYFSFIDKRTGTTAVTVKHRDNKLSFVFL